MFRRASVAPVETLTIGEPQPPTSWGFRRRSEAQPRPTPAPAEDAGFAAEAGSIGFEVFGRAGLQLGGLHRDQQWVGAWGGRC
jgi:hypothetical protein